MHQYKDSRKSGEPKTFPHLAHCIFGRQCTLILVLGFANFGTQCFVGIECVPGPSRRREECSVLRIVALNVIVGFLRIISRFSLVWTFPRELGVVRDSLQSLVTTALKYSRIYLILRTELAVGYLIPDNTGLPINHQKIIIKIEEILTLINTLKIQNQ